MGLGPAQRNVSTSPGRNGAKLLRHEYLAVCASQRHSPAANPAANRKALGRPRPGPRTSRTAAAGCGSEVVRCAPRKLRSQSTGATHFPSNCQVARLGLGVRSPTNDPISGRAYLGLCLAAAVVGLVTSVGVWLFMKGFGLINSLTLGRFD